MLTGALVTLFDNIPLILGRGPKARDNAALEMAGAIYDKVQDELAQPGRGRVYGDHIASAPGDPPATDTGALAAGIDFRLAGDGIAEVSAGDPEAPGKAMALEFGRVDGHFAARPFMYPAVRAVQPDFPDLVGKVVVDEWILGEAGRVLERSTLSRGDVIHRRASMRRAHRAGTKSYRTSHPVRRRRTGRG